MSPNVHVDGEVHANTSKSVDVGVVNSGGPRRHFPAVAPTGVDLNKAQTVDANGRTWGSPRKGLSVGHS